MTDGRQLIKNSKNGQSLIEILIAVTVGGILIVSAATLITSALRISSENKFFQGASFLSQDLIGKVGVFAERQWNCSNTPLACGIYDLNKGSSNHYYISTTTSSFSLKEGDESIPINGVDYKRYFYIEDVSRDSRGNIEQVYNSSNEDISTQKVTAVTVLPSGGEVKIVKYVTRNRNKVFAQTDWSGGDGHGEVFTALSSIDVFDEENNIFFGKIGSIEISAF